MGFDTWLEQDIRSFLDTRMTEETTPQVTRLEDTAAIYANKDWKKEIESRLQQGDTAGAKQLFAQLRLKYLGTPKDHEAERASLYTTMQDCYVLIANHVLSDWHSKEMLRRMDASSENVFDENVKPVDLNAQRDANASGIAPDVPQFTRATAAQLEPLQALKESDGITLPPRDHDPFSFEPEALIHAAHATEEHIKENERQASGLAPRRQPPAPTQPTSPQSSTSPSPAPPKPIDTKSIGPSPALVTKLKEAMTLAKSEPEKAIAILKTLTGLDIHAAISGPAKKLLEGIEKHLAEKQHQTLFGTRSLSPREAALAKARAAALAYERVAKQVHDEIARAGAYARARDIDKADAALGRARVLIDDLEKEHPGPAKLLRERLERSAQLIVHHDLHGTGKHHTKAYYELLDALGAVKQSLTARNRTRFATAIAKLEQAARDVPQEHRQLITETITLLRERASEKRT